MIDKLTEPGTCLFVGDWQDRQSYIMQNPIQVLSSHDPSDIFELLGQVENLLKEGFYAAGYLAYESSEAFELPVIKNHSQNPLIWFAIYDKKSVISVSLKEIFGDIDSNSLELNYPLDLNFTEVEYSKAIKKIKDLISAGDTYQVNFTCRTGFNYDIKPELLFLKLYRSHPVPYAAYCNCGAHKILSLSPELFLRRTENLIETKPMKGTIKRGLNLAEDKVMVDRLKSSSKNRAENIMIVDMMRNDLGRICEHGSVETSDIYTIETYRSLHQMTSRVNGCLKPDVSLSEIFSATFPLHRLQAHPSAELWKSSQIWKKNLAEFTQVQLDIFLQTGILLLMLLFGLL